MEAKIYLKHYRLHLDRIGLPVVIRRSATEATFRGEDMRTGEGVAVQVVPVEALSTVVREELEGEAKTARELDHINIPRLRDSGVEDGQMIYVTEYFDGTTAGDWVKSRGPMPVGAVLRIAQQVVNASSLATFHGIVHHAINPSNIMLVPGQTPEGEWPLIKVLNFVGVAPNLAPQDSTEGEAFNPAQFASPEQMQTGAVDFRSQMYSLGATLSFLLTGSVPLEGAASVDEASRIPAAVKNLLAHMLAADPAERPLDPLALQAHIQDCLKQLDRRDAVASTLGLPLASEATQPIKSPRRPFPWRPLAFAAVLFILATISAVALSGHLRRSKPVRVEIGVSEKSAAAVAVVPTPAPVMTPGEVVVAPPGQEPPVVASTESAQAEEAKAGAANEAQTEVAAATPEPQPEISAQPTVSETARIAAADASTPVTTAKVETAAPPNEKSTEVAEEATQVQKPIKKREEEEIAPPKAKPRESKPEVAKSSERKKIPVAAKADDEERSSSQHAPVRAQFLGTTPDGNLVFGLPSSEKVYMTPPVQDEARQKPTRRARRSSPPPETIDGLPVRPALPPDQ